MLHVDVFNPRLLQNKRRVSKLQPRKVGLCLLDAQSCDLISARIQPALG